MKTLRSLAFICISGILLSCGGADDKEGKATEKEARESADKAAEKSFEKLNKDGNDTAKSDSTAE